jgi:hypothetical protein
MVNSELIPSAKHDAKDLVGTRTLVSVVTERDGRKFDTYGPNAKGLLVFDSKGRYSIIFIAADLPKFVSGSRSSGRNLSASCAKTTRLEHNLLCE